MDNYSKYVPSSPFSSPYSNDVHQDARRISRTPSPTPSEIQALDQKGFFNWKSIFDRKKMWSKKRIIIYIAMTIAAVLGALFIFYHDQIVHSIQPAANWMHNFKFGWIIPIAIFFVISFPPLFGHEILAIVCGLVWGVWVGFGIVAAGTFIGEIGNFYAFRYLCTTRGEKIEKGSVIYSSLGRVVREGGFKIALIARYSAIPPHFTTALFAVCGMNIFIFMLAAALSMPKQFITVYIGTLLESSATSTANTKNEIISDIVGVVTVLITIAAMWYITREINRVKPQIVYERRKARQAKLDAESESLYQNGGANTSAVFNTSDTTLPLNTFSDAPYDPPYQQWDSEGRAVGYAPDPRIHAPQPKKPENLNPLPGDITPTLGTKPLRHESTDTVGWELQANAAQGQSYRLSAMAAEPLRNPYGGEGEMDAEEVVGGGYPPGPPSLAGRPSLSGVGRPPSSGISGVAAYAPPPGPPPPPPGAGYAFSAPGHSFSGASSPPPPSYATRQ